ncbi:unnamed protein product, partial [Effrenium voratum]
RPGAALGCGSGSSRCSGARCWLWPVGRVAGHAKERCAARCAATCFCWRTWPDGGSGTAATWKGGGPPSHPVWCQSFSSCLEPRAGKREGLLLPGAQRADVFLRGRRLA